MADLNQRTNALRTRIEQSATIESADSDALIAFSDELRFRKSEYSHERHLELLSHLTILAGDSQKYDPEELPDVRLVDASTEVVSGRYSVGSPTHTPRSTGCPGHLTCLGLPVNAMVDPPGTPEAPTLGPTLGNQGGTPLDDRANVGWLG